MPAVLLWTDEKLWTITLTILHVSCKFGLSIPFFHGRPNSIHSFPNATANVIWRTQISYPSWLVRSSAFLQLDWGCLGCSRSETQGTLVADKFICGSWKHSESPDSNDRVSWVREGPNGLEIGLQLCRNGVEYRASSNLLNMVLL